MHFSCFCSLNGIQGSVMAKVLIYDLKVNEFELQSRYYVLFRLRKGIELFILPNYGLNSITVVFQQG